ncbi:MAG TPA: Calx-beta domain-containing protein [Acidimicrobiales bacterium]|nr:Calx-beta domain-containing protein [Acidimicrobiales bacterium]
MIRRLHIAAVAALVAAVSLSVVSPARAHAGPGFGRTALPPARPAKVSAQDLASPAFPYADTFKLHSLSGAQRVVYLDFDGEFISGTAWNDEFNNGSSFDAPAYDVDGNAATFGNGELDLIQSAWQRVAEDFAPFAVDVTTEEPPVSAIDRVGSGDVFFGTKALITNTTTIYDVCGCAGVGYIGTFGITANHQRYQPALIFGKAIGAYAKDLGDAITHEVGHNLGLDHDGKGASDYYDGQGAWAPLMGSGFYRPITQWSKGEYADATNTQDDMVVMQQNGAPLRADDVGNSVTTAAPFSATGASVGVISTDADSDVFSFVSDGGAPSFSAAPAPRGPNLDVRLDILNAAGTVLASADPVSGATDYDTPTGLGATVAAPTTAGQSYYVRVQGVGSGDPVTTGYSGYGSLGQYTLTGPVSTAVVAPSVSVGDVVVAEGNSGTSDATFTLTLSGAASVPVTVQIATSAITASAGSDFTMVSGAVTIPAGETTATFGVPIIGDTAPEPHEKFVVSISADNATVVDQTASGTIFNDDGVGISVDDVAKFEGAAGTFTVFTFTISLTKSPTSTITVTFTTSNGTAVAPGDYSAKTRTLSFAPGEKTKTFTVVAKGDGVKEPSETFNVVLTNPTGTGAKIIDATGIGYIRNDDT